MDLSSNVRRVNDHQVESVMQVPGHRTDKNRNNNSDWLIFEGNYNGYFSCGPTMETVFLTPNAIAIDEAGRLKALELVLLRMAEPSVLTTRKASAHLVNNGAEPLLTLAAMSTLLDIAHTIHTSLPNMSPVSHT